MDNKLIFDIGLHTGEDTIYYLKKGYRVLAVEANPQMAEQCSKKFEEYIKNGRLTILNVGIAETEGAILPFYVSKHLSEWSSFDKSNATKNNSDYYTVEVPCTTQKKIFEEYGIPYYLKVDIEGYDYLAIKDIPASGDKPKYVSFEAGDIDWLDIVHDKGYTKFKLINQLTYTDINLKTEGSKLFILYMHTLYALKRRLPFLPFRHKSGSAGPFGNDLKGEWHTCEDIKAMYIEYNRSIRPKNNVSWFDCHATF